MCLRVPLRTAYHPSLVLKLINRNENGNSVGQAQCNWDLNLQGIQLSLRSEVEQAPKHLKGEQAQEQS